VTLQLRTIINLSILVPLLIGSILPIAAQDITTYSDLAIPTPFLTPRLEWVITNVTTEAVEWGWGTGDYWQANAGQRITYIINEIKNDEIHGLLSIGNLTLLTNDSRLAAELTLSIWPWFPGLISHLDWTVVDQNARSAATGWMEGTLEIQTTATTKIYTYQQGLFGNQNTTLAYDLQTGLLKAAYTEFYFQKDYHLGIELAEAIKEPSPLTVTLVEFSLIFVLLIFLIIVVLRFRKKRIAESKSQFTARKVAFVAIMAATALAGNYALSGIPNVETSSVLVFLSGFLFGPSIGAMVGLITMSIYQFWNPWGAFIPPIGIAVIGSTILTGLIGGLLGKILNSKSSASAQFLWPAIFGMLSTLFFDTATNYAYSITFGVPFIIALLTGLPFSIIHIMTNGFLFGLLTPPVIHAVEQYQIEQYTNSTGNND
jgi:hypothetical protein